jgi:hypothetical protein
VQLEANVSSQPAGRLYPLRRGRQLLVVAVFAAVGPLVALVAELVASANAAPRSGFFDACAVVAPLPGLALFIDIAVLVNLIVASQGLTDANRALARVLLWSNAVLLLSAEAFALYATASGHETIFLAVATIVPLLLQVFLLIEVALVKMRVNVVRAG